MCKLEYNLSRHNFLGFKEIFMKASKYILSNIQPGETLVRVLSMGGLTKGWFSDIPEVALTDKRIFARNTDGKSYSFPASKIKNVEVRPGGLFGGKSSGKIAVIGPYNHEIVFTSKNLTADRDFIMKTLKLSF